MVGQHLLVRPRNGEKDERLHDERERESFERRSARSRAWVATANMVMQVASQAKKRWVREGKYRVHIGQQGKVVEGGNVREEVHNTSMVDEVTQSEVKRP